MTNLELLIIFAALVAGGVMKGATGAGAPLLAVPAMSAIVDLRFAIVIMLIPAILTNIWQAWAYRDRWRTLPFAGPFLLASAAGMVLGTFALATLPLRLLTTGLTVMLLAFIAFRLLKPALRLDLEAGRRIAIPVGMSAGFLQGASGLSGPIVLPYLAAMRLGREGFAGTISLFFLLLGLVQLPSLAVTGLLVPKMLLLSLLALVPVCLGMVIGARFGRRMSPAAFERLVVLLLCAIALKLVHDAAFGL